MDCIEGILKPDMCVFFPLVNTKSLFKNVQVSDSRINCYQEGFRGLPGSLPSVFSSHAGAAMSPLF